MALTNAERSQRSRDRDKARLKFVTLEVTETMIDFLMAEGCLDPFQNDNPIAIGNAILEYIGVQTWAKYQQHKK
jgi:hypothetical protein